MKTTKRKELVETSSKIKSQENILKKIEEADIIIVGAGISGATLAERFANVLNKKVLVIEKRDHIGGNCYDYYNKDGIQIHKYGPHLFHTNHEDVWEYINKFSSWYPYKHKVLSFVDGKLVPVPVNIDTVNILFNLNIKNESEMKEWLEKNVSKISNPKNSEESAISRVGKVLYEKMFKNYTKKQWDMWPSELDASVMNRIPVRTTHEEGYFSDKYQYLPTKGYTNIFENMLNHQNITVMLNTDYFDIENKIITPKLLFFTGPIDTYILKKQKLKLGKLQYRSIKFVFETYNKEYYQSNSVINYPEMNEKFTRIVEYKYFTGQKHPKTTISKEYSTWEGEPYYPVPSETNKELYSKYKEEAEKLEGNNIYFVGRLAEYKYFNMDQAFKNALDLFEKVKKTFENK